MLLFATNALADTGRRYGNDAYMLCCEKRLLVYVPGGAWEMLDRDENCVEYVKKHPEAVGGICRQAEQDIKGGACPELAEICRCSYRTACSHLGLVISLARNALLTAKEPGGNKTFNTPRSIKASKGLKQALEGALSNAKARMCDGAAKQAIDAALDQLGDLNNDPKASKDMHNNSIVLKRIEALMWQIARDTCGAGDQGPCAVPPLPELSGLAQHDCETNCRDCETRVNPDTGKPYVSTDVKSALDCLRKAGVSPGSTYRSKDYQRHFWDLYQGYLALLRSTNPNCSERLIQYAVHMKHHSILGSVTNPDTNSASMHPKGGALDGPANLSERTQACCNLYKRYPVADPIHYEVCKPPCTEKCK